MKRDFVDMAEFLKNNTEAESRQCSSKRQTGQGHTGHAMSRKEVPDLMSWLWCFGIYAVVLCDKYPEDLRETSLPGHHDQQVLPVSERRTAIV